MSHKTAKIGSNFVKEISYIIMEEVKDPDIKFVTITDCDVTNDLSFAKVYFTVLNRDKKEDTIKALNNASNYIELELSKRIDIRKMPDISFIYDESVEYGEYIDNLLEKIEKEEDAN